MSRNRSVAALSAREMALAERLVIARQGGDLVLNKPPHIACTSRDRNETTVDRLLAAFARSNGKRPHLVHRIDRETSGVLLAAETVPRARALTAAFEARMVRKTYVALVAGHVAANARGQIDQAIRRASRPGGREVAELAETGAPGAKSAVTVWRCLAATPTHALIEARPQTGRLHQIRLHLTSLGLPILGDGRHGSARAEAARLMLHAWRLEVPGATGARLGYQAAVPDDFRGKAEQLGLAAGLPKEQASPLAPTGEDPYGVAG